MLERTARLAIRAPRRVIAIALLDHGRYGGFRHTCGEQPVRGRVRGSELAVPQQADEPVGQQVASRRLARC